LAGLAIALIGAWLWRRRQRAVLDDTEHDGFAARIRRQLNITESATDAVD